VAPLPGRCGAEMFGNIFHDRRVLVTGHTGFKGSWLVAWLRRLGAHVHGMALPPDTDPSHWQLLGFGDVADHQIDIRDRDAVHRVFERSRPDIVFHLAAQPLVRRSYRDPVSTFETNVMGLVNVFEAVRQAPSVRVFVNATTDKVYAEHDAPTGYRETDPLGGHDPYSASKAAAEIVTTSYRKSFFADGPRIATARAGNVIGGGDWAEDRLLPDVVRACASATPVAVRNPTAIRPWQHVLEPLSGYLCLAAHLWRGGADASHAWNFGPAHDADLPVSVLLDRIQAAWPDFVANVASGHHPHEAAVLRLDSSLARKELGWHSLWDAGTAVERTVSWYRTFHANGSLRTMEDIEAYETGARERGYPWV